jgi:hypothetical protein
LSHSDADVDSVRKAIRTIATIHPALSTRIFYRKDVPVDAYIDGCEVYQHLTFEDPVIEYTVLDTDFDNDVQEKAFFQSKVTPFDLFRDRLYRIGIFETPGMLYLFFDVHHIIETGTASGFWRMTSPPFCPAKAFLPRSSPSRIISRRKRMPESFRRTARNTSMR